MVDRERLVRLRHRMESWGDISAPVTSRGLRALMQRNFPPSDGDVAVPRYSLLNWGSVLAARHRGGSDMGLWKRAKLR